MSLAESQRFYFDLCAKADTIKEVGQNRQQILQKYFRSDKDRDYLARYPTERFRVYRHHVSEGFLGGIEEVFPITRSLLTRTEWNDLINDFYLKRQTRSPLARQVFDEFSLYLQYYQGPLCQKFPFLHELAEYERLELRLTFATDKTIDTPHMMVVPQDPLSLIPLLNPHLVLRVYHWPVYKISPEDPHPEELEQGHYPLIVYRHPETLKVSFLEGNVLFADLIDAMRPGRRSIRRILGDLARQYRIPPSQRERFFGEGAQTIIRLREKGIVIGMKNLQRRKTCKEAH